MKNLAFAGIACLFLGSCSSSVRLPLCPAIAANSYATSNRLAIINRYTLEQAEARGIKVGALSSFAAEFTGPQTEIDWLKSNYKFMLCAFNPTLEIDDRATYLSCMAHADEWTAITSSEKPEYLLITQSKFKENCVTSGVFGARRRE